jgi:hypothetical protein
MVVIPFWAPGLFMEPMLELSQAEVTGSAQERCIDIPGRPLAGHGWGSEWWRRRLVEAWSDAA